jgi:anti-sigma factor RsiW
MNGRACETFRDRLVEHTTGDLSALEAAETQAHLDRCEDCAAEAELLRGLAAARRAAPAGLADGILAAYREEASPGIAAYRDGGPAVALRRVTRPAWFRGLPMAAAVAGVLLVGALVARTGVVRDAPPEEVALAQEAGMAILPWPGDDGLLAGAPALDALTDDEIEARLEELDS